MKLPPHSFETSYLSASLSAVAQQQYVIEYWREGSSSTALPPTFASGIVSQHNKLGDFTFGTALVFVYAYVVVCVCVFLYVVDKHLHIVHFQL